MNNIAKRRHEHVNFLLILRLFQKYSFLSSPKTQIEIRMTITSLDYIKYDNRNVARDDYFEIMIIKS